VCLCLSLYVCLCVCVCDSTKQMIVDVVRCQKSGDSLVDVLRRSVTPDEVSHLTPVLPVHMCRHTLIAVTQSPKTTMAKLWCVLNAAAQVISDT